MATPAFAQMTAPSAWHCIEFISDLHLAEDTPEGFHAWAEYMETTRADAIFILGDLFEAWIGDDSRHTGFEARCTEVLTRTASRRAVAFMVGNRDFLVGADMLQACAVMALADPTVLNAFGERVMLSHGDELCVADVAYQRLRAKVRNSAWQAQVLAHSLAERQVMAKQMRIESQEQQNQSSTPWFDVDRATALEWMRSAGTPVLIHGHTHRPATEHLAPGFTRQVLSDWDFDSERPPRAEVLRWQASGMTRVALEHTAARA